MTKTEIPELVSATGAAKILGIWPPHISRIRRAGRMPPAIPVGGGHAVYERSAVEALAKEIAAEREKTRKEREKARSAA